MNEVPKQSLPGDLVVVYGSIQGLIDHRCDGHFRAKVMKAMTGSDWVKVRTETQGNRE